MCSLKLFQRAIQYLHGDFGNVYAYFEEKYKRVFFIYFKKIVMNEDNL